MKGRFLIDEKIIYQFKGLDCGSVALENTLFLMDGIQRDVILPSPSSMLDLYDVSTKLGFHSKGITEMSIDRLREIILEKDTKCIVLLNAFYPFVGLWVRLTRIMLKILIGRQKALHWVVVHKVDDNRIVFIDPYFGYVKMPMRFFKDAWSKTALVIRK